jgi:hypothetical protein
MSSHSPSRSALALTLLVVVAGLAVAVGAGLPTLWQRERPGSFAVRCVWSHSLRDDPILAPDEPGVSHLHAFFGARAARAGATRRDLMRSSTTCSDPADTAAVWVPAGTLKGQLRTPLWERTYYFGNGAQVGTVPANLKMIGGDPHATAPSDNPDVSWSCGNGTPIATHPYDCRPYRRTRPSVHGIVGRIEFPTCWDGSTLDPLERASGVVHPVGRGCADDHPHRIPRVSVRVQFGVLDPCAGATPCGPDDDDAPIAFGLTSGPYHTLHADFWNTWDQRALDRLVRRCLHASTDCGNQGPSHGASP